MSRAKFTFVMILVLVVMTGTVTVTVWQIISRRQVQPDQTLAPDRLKSFCTTSRPWKPWNYIIIHHTAARSGSIESIHQGHLRRGWEGIGYHFLIGNGHGMNDGRIEATYRWTGQLPGSHARGYSRSAVGICLVGDFNTGSNRPTAAQMEALAQLAAYLKVRLNLDEKRIKLHSQIGQTMCPGRNFPEGLFRKRMSHYADTYTRR